LPRRLKKGENARLIKGSVCYSYDQRGRSGGRNPFNRTTHNFERSLQGERGRATSKFPIEVDRRSTGTNLGRWTLPLECNLPKWGKKAVVWKEQVRQRGSGGTRSPSVDLKKKSF